MKTDLKVMLIYEIENACLRWYVPSFAISKSQYWQ